MDLIKAGTMIAITLIVGVTVNSIFGKTEKENPTIVSQESYSNMILNCSGQVHCIEIIQRNNTTDHRSVVDQDFISINREKCTAMTKLSLIESCQKDLSKNYKTKEQ